LGVSEGDYVGPILIHVSISACLLYNYYYSHNYWYFKTWSSITCEYRV